MNVYEKLQICRVELQNAGLKKSGSNKYAGYEYFELADFLPKINELFLKNKLIGVVSFGSDMAVLEVINIEKPDEKIVFTSPMSEASLKGCHPVQNLGAVETYQRRYLYMTAMEIVEADPLDVGVPDTKPAESKPSTKSTKSATDNDTQDKAETPKTTDEQIKEIFALGKRKEKEVNGYNFFADLESMAAVGHITKSAPYADKTRKSINWTVKDYEYIKSQLDLPF